MNTVFKGEHLLPGQIGQFFVVISFAAALLSTISYYFAATNKDKLDNSWLKMGRIAFYLNTVSILGLGTCLFYIIYNHYFEYHYAWSYTSRSLPVYYIIAGFWNGQEGGFLLWAFWQAVLGNILIRRAKSWESSVMTIMSLSQILLASMLLGIEFFGQRIGSSPFLLLRNSGIPAPIFSQTNYLDFIKDGQGMNPLLQNYWMVIHPPVLFLGLASVAVPFSYGIAGLWQKRYKEWVNPAISWSLFGAMILGVGVIMGSLWAYESLNFGGFWAWDPVENASIFPWLTLVAGLHVLIVFKNTGHSYFTATLLILLSFVMVLYESFLARSGVLGESSVHAFTDLGMFGQLVLYILIFLALSIYLLVARWKELPITKKDEETYSREFWMFVGSVFLCLSCLHLVGVTSIPVWNKMFGTHAAPPTDLVTHYNIIQSSFAVVITLLTGFTQFLKYKKTDTTRFFIITVLYLVFAALITTLIVYVTGLYKLHTVFLFVMLGAVYTVLVNGKILADAFKGKFKLAGSAVAHIGFGLMLVGALIAAGTRKVVSQNDKGIALANFTKAANERENIMIYKNEPTRMGPYVVTYIGDSVSEPNHYYKVNYKRFDDNGKLVEQFLLKPNVQINPQMGLTPSPDTRHYLFRDLYTHITALPPLKQKPANAMADAGHGQENDDQNYDDPIKHQVGVGDTIHYRDGYIIVKGLNKKPQVQDITLTGNDIAVGAQLQVVTHDKTYDVEPVFMIKNNSVFDFARKVEDAGLKLRFSKIIPEKGEVEITLYQQPENKKPWIVMSALEFPYINFLWSGTIIMVIGFLLSISRRNKELKTI